jgi:hypothetical protein
MTVLHDAVSFEAKNRFYVTASYEAVPTYKEHTALKGNKTFLFVEKKPQPNDVQPV